MTNQFYSLLLFLCTINLVGCVIDTVPLPENSKESSTSADSEAGAFGDPNEDQADSDQGNSTESSPSTPEDASQTIVGINLDSIYYSDEPVELVGAPGALSGEGTLRIETTNSWAVEVATTADGTFAVQIEARLDDTIALFYTDANGEEYSASLSLSPGSVDAYSATATLSGASSDAAEQSYITLTRENSGVVLQVAPGTLSPGIGVVVGNSALGTSAFSMAEANGSLEISLKADSGDELIVFAVEPGASRGGGTPIALDSP